MQHGTLNTVSIQKILVKFNFILFPIVLILVNIKILKKIGESTISLLQKWLYSKSSLNTVDRLYDFKQNDV